MKLYLPLHKELNPTGLLSFGHVESSGFAVISDEGFKDITKEVLWIIPNKEEC
jgi:hypothetical protein